MYIYMYIYIYIYNTVWIQTNKNLLYATIGFMCCTQSSGIHIFILKKTRK